MTYPHPQSIRYGATSWGAKPLQVAMTDGSLVCVKDVHAYIARYTQTENVWAAPAATATAAGSRLYL